MEFTNYLIQCKNYLYDHIFLLLLLLSLILVEFEQKYVYVRYADKVLVGDEVLVPGNKVLVPTKVMYISSFKMQGNHKFCFLFL